MIFTPYNIEENLKLNVRLEKTSYKKCFAGFPYP